MSSKPTPPASLTSNSMDQPMEEGQGVSTTPQDYYDVARLSSMLKAYRRLQEIHARHSISPFLQWVVDDGGIGNESTMATQEDLPAQFEPSNSKQLNRGETDPVDATAPVSYAIHTDTQTSTAQFCTLSEKPVPTDQTIRPPSPPSSCPTRISSSSSSSPSPTPQQLAPTD